MAEEDNHQIEMKISFASGDQVRITVDYPPDKGILAVQALVEAGEPGRIQGLLAGLTEDPSVQHALKNAGLVFDDDGDDE